MYESEAPPAESPPRSGTLYGAPSITTATLLRLRPDTTEEIKSAAAATNRLSGLLPGVRIRKFTDADGATPELSNPRLMTLLIITRASRTSGHSRMIWV